MSVLGGQAEVSLNEITIPADLLSEVNVEIMSGTRERTTLAGTFTRPSGTLDTAQATFTMFLPSIDYLKNIVPAQFNAPTTPQTTGNVIWGASSCTVTSTPVNIHFVCDTTDDNDVFFPEAEVMLNFNPSYTSSDELTVEVTVFGQPSSTGVVARAGTGNLTAASIYNAATEATDTI